MVEPRIRGEPGYTDWGMCLIEAGICACDDCGGHLVDDVCLSCGCRTWIAEATRFQPRGVAWIPVYVSGRCAHADAVRAQTARENERARRRSWGEE